MVEHTRTLDFKTAFAIGLGTMIAAGIFSLSGTAVAEIGSSAVIAFVIAAVIAGITAAAYSEFASIYSENGGGYLFTSRTFEDRQLLTYGIGMSLFLGYTGTTAFYLSTMDEWFFRFIIPEGLHWLPHGTTAVAAAVLLGTLNARGTEESGNFQLLVSGAKVAVLFAFIGGAFAFRGPSTAVSNFTAQFSTDLFGILEISALAFITFFGFSAIAASAGEIIEPRKTVPRAIAASIVSVTILYALVIVAMTNSTVPPEIIAREGETAMGEVAAGFLGPFGRSLIVAGAIFSMVSASNASILAASSIGSLMGRQGQAPRAFSRIHTRFNTPFWSVTAATATIVALIVSFIMLFPAEGGFLPINLGLTVLTGFATFNLLLPLAVVNAALIYHRRLYPDIERGFRVPGVPVVPVFGIIANIGLITNLPMVGVGTGIGLTAILLVVYVVWGGGKDIDELVQRVDTQEPTASGQGTENGSDDDDDQFRILVPVARPSNAPEYIRLAEVLGTGHNGSPLIEVLTVTEVPEQTPHETMAEIATERVESIESALTEEDLSADYTVEGRTCRDVAFAILQAAREDSADLIVMGYPEENEEITTKVEYTAPCDVVFASGLTEDPISQINIGAGGGPHHLAAANLVRNMGEQGYSVNVISVDPTGEGTTEDPATTVSELGGVPDLHVYNVSAASIAEGLVSKSKEEGGILMIGASRDRRLRRWVFGSTPDSVIERAKLDGVPVLVYASSTSVPERIEDYLFPIYRYLLKLRNRSQTSTDQSSVES
ncbi:amino acid permease [Halovenus halobia]|uniref:amino acid permease n=1 Tax=Halovenus halobia TaxID=3396622 RepID=UPI003F553C9B